MSTARSRRRTHRGRRMWLASVPALTALVAGGVLPQGASAAEAAAEAAEAPAATPSDIAYTHWTSTNTIEDVFRIRPDGTGRTALTSTPAISDRDPDWNPAGTKVAFHRYGSGGAITGIWTMNADGSGLAAVPNTDDGHSASWAPDGGRLAFVCPDPAGGDDEICVVNLDGTGLRRLTSTPGFEAGPAWSPGGSEIAFSRTPPTHDRARLLAIKPATLAERSITPLVADRHDSSPAWSPDGSRLAFVRFIAGSGRGGVLRVVNAGGTGGRVVSAPAPGTDIHHITPAWSPTGARIAFSIADDDLAFGHLFTIRPDGTGRRQVTFGAVTDLDPTWR